VFIYLRSFYLLYAARVLYMLTALNLRLKGCTFALAAPLSDSNLRQVVHTHMPLFTEQYKSVLTPRIALTVYQYF